MVQEQIESAKLHPWGSWDMSGIKLVMNADGEMAYLKRNKTSFDILSYPRSATSETIVVDIAENSERTAPMPGKEGLVPTF